jgi:hypothetical protein
MLVGGRTRPLSVYTIVFHVSQLRASETNRSKPVLKAFILPGDPLFAFQSCHLILFHASGLIFSQRFGIGKVAKQKQSLVMSRG